RRERCPPAGILRGSGRTVPSRSSLNPPCNLLNAGEETLFTIELDRLAPRVADGGSVKARQLGPPHDHNARRIGPRHPDPHISADQQATGIGGGILFPGL